MVEEKENPSHSSAARSVFLCVPHEIALLGPQLAWESSTPEGDAGALGDEG